LFGVLSRELAIPEYFGQQLDALSDVVEISHGYAKRSVIVSHEIFARASERRSLVYLDILSDCMRSWRGAQEHQLVVSFPTNLRDAIAKIASGGNNRSE